VAARGTGGVLLPRRANEVSSTIDAGAEQIRNQIDQVLAAYRPFANSDYISGQFQTCYKRKLVKLSDAFPVAGEIVDALDRADPLTARRILSDTSVRTVVEHLRRAVVTGSSGIYSLAPLDLCRDLLDATARFANRKDSSGPLNCSSDHRLGTQAHHPWVWSDGRLPDDEFVSAFRWLVEAHYGNVPDGATAKEVSALRQGVKLLEELLPKSAPSVLSHTQTVVIIPAAGVWEKMQSSSQYLLGGTVFLSSLVLDKPWLVAELLYHESIHQKLYDFQRGHTVLELDSVLDPDSVPDSEVRVTSPWNYPDNEWDTHRILAAFHVYVHVALLCSIADERAEQLAAEYGPKTGMTPTRAAFDRAQYLGHSLREKACWDELGSAGKLLVEWLTSILDALDPAPPPLGASLHLLLNRYEREAARVLRSQEYSEVTYQAEILSRDEPVVVAYILEQLGERTAAEHLKSSVAACATAPPHVRFAQVRKSILDAVRQCCPDGYSLIVPPASQVDLNGLLAAMVERSSRLLVAAQQINELGEEPVHALLGGTRIGAVTAATL
jgi:hypothetical protein